MLLEALFLLVWSALEALILWRIFSGKFRPEPPVCYGYVYLVRPDRRSTPGSPNFYRRP